MDVRGADVTQKQLRDDLITLLIAGHETTGSMLTYPPPPISLSLSCSPSLSLSHTLSLSRSLSLSGSLAVSPSLALSLFR